MRLRICVCVCARDVLSLCLCSFMFVHACLRVRMYLRVNICDCVCVCGRACLWTCALSGLWHRPLRSLYLPLHLFSSMILWWKSESSRPVQVAEVAATSDIKKEAAAYIVNSFFHLLPSAFLWNCARCVDREQVHLSTSQGQVLWGFHAPSAPLFGSPHCQKRSSASLRFHSGSSTFMVHVSYSCQLSLCIVFWTRIFFITVTLCLSSGIMD